MGIHLLMKLLQEKCPGAIRTVNLKSYIGRVVACDASMVCLIVMLFNLIVDISISNFYTTCEAWLGTY